MGPTVVSEHYLFIEISGQVPINEKGNYGAENDKMILKNHLTSHENCLTSLCFVM